MRLNGEEVEPYEGSLSAFLNSLSIQLKGVAVSVEGEIVPKSEWSNTHLFGVEEIEVVTAAAGG